MADHPKPMRPLSATRRPCSPRLPAGAPRPSPRPTSANSNGRFGATPSSAFNRHARAVSRKQTTSLKGSTPLDVLQEFTIPAAQVSSLRPPLRQDGSETVGRAEGSAAETASSTPSPPRPASAIELDSMLKKMTAQQQAAIIDTKHQDSEAARRNMRYYFKLLGESVQRERDSMGSFAIICENALAATRSACSELGAGPNRLETAVASMLLMNLSYIIGPSYGEMMRRLLNIVFGAVYEVEEASIRGGASSSSNNTQPTPTDSSAGGELNKKKKGEGCSSSGRASPSQFVAQLPDPVATQPSATYDVFINTKLFVESNAELRDTNTRMDLRLHEMRATIRRSTAQMATWTSRVAADTVKTCFLAWRGIIRERPRQQDAWINILSKSRDKTVKELYFLRWKIFSYVFQNTAQVQLAAKNHSKLSERVSLLTHRCTLREDELSKYRTAKDRHAARAEQLEAMMAVDRNDAAKAKAKATSLAAENSNLLQLANQLFSALDGTSNPLLAGMVPSVVEALSNGNSRRRQLKEVHRLGTVMNADDFVVPFLAKTSGSAYRQAHLDDVQAFLKGWINATLKNIRDQAEDLATSPNRDVPEVAQHVAMVRSSPLSMENFCKSLSDGKILLLVLWRVAQEERAGSRAKEFYLPPCDNDAERCSLVVRMALYWGIDGSIQPLHILKASEHEKLMVPFVARIFSLFANSNAALLRSGTPQMHSLVAATTSASTGTMNSNGNLSGESLFAAFQQFQESSNRVQRWKQLSRCVDNYCQSAVINDTSDQSAMEAVREVTNTLTADAVKPLLPPAAARFSAPEEPSGSGGGQQKSLDGTTSEADSAVADEAQDFFITEVRGILGTNAKAIRSAAEFYAAHSTGECSHHPAGGAIDITGWHRFLQDTKLVTSKLVTKAVSEQVFKSLCALTQQQQAMGSTSTGGTSPLGSPGPAPPQSATALPPTTTTPTASPQGTVASATTAATPATEEPWMHRHLFGLGLLHLFLSKIEPSATATLTNHAAMQLMWTNADDGVMKFKAFIKDHIIAHVGTSLLDHVVVPYNTIAVQDILRALRDPLRKVFLEFAKEKDSSGASRVRIEQFVQFCAKDIKCLDAADGALLFHSLKNYATAAAAADDDAQQQQQQQAQENSVLNSSEPTSPPRPGTEASSTSTTTATATATKQQAKNIGLDFSAFSIAIVALSRVKCGFPLLSDGDALKNFLVTFVFPHYAFRLKLKW